jgi:hypothetical protein
MRHKNIFRSILLIISIFLITSCSNNSAMKPEDFKNKEPRLVIEEYMTGNVKLGVYCKIDLEKLLDNFLPI